MNVALVGSVSSSFHTLEAFVRAGVEVTCVCGVDASRSGKICDYRDLKPVAEEAGIPYLPFIKVTEPRVKEFLRGHRPDLLWVIGLSQLVPHNIIEIARSGGVGFHPTLLPKGRGRAPVAWTIILDQPAAVSLFYLTAEADAGDIIAQREVSVLPDDYSEDLIQRTNEVLSDVIIELAPAIKAGAIPRRPQDHSRATFYARRTEADGQIDWSQPTDGIYRLIRAAGRPYHGAFTYIGHDKVTIWRARPGAVPTASNLRAVRPGTVLEVDAAAVPLVRTVDGAIHLTEFVVAGQGRSKAKISLPARARLGPPWPCDCAGEAGRESAAHGRWLGHR